MALFEKAFEKTIKAEGGYVNNPNDKGGETYMGVTRKYYGHLSMWEWIDNYKKQFKGKQLNDKLKDCIPVQKDVQSVYLNNYWRPLRLSEVYSQKVANQFFDNAINCGIKATIKLMQRIAGMKETGNMTNTLINKYIKQNDKR